MLNLVWLSRLSFKDKIWKNFDREKQNWIVGDAISSDIPFLKMDLLSQSQIIGGKPVKRASELWREILRKCDPSIRVINSFATQVLARDFLERSGKSEWCQRPRAPQKLLDACKNLTQFVTNESSGEIIREFQAKFGKSGETFTEIAFLASEFYKECLMLKRLPLFFLPQFLASFDRLPTMPYQIIFDLGFDMSQGERDLIQRLSISNHLTVLIPASNPAELNDKRLFAYKDIALGVALVHEDYLKETEKYFIPEIELLRCSSPNAEARKASEIVADYLANGAKASEISVAAPDISDYEAMLDQDLGWEGLGIKRDLKTELASSRLFRALSARLELVMGRIDNNILEEAFLSVSNYRMAIQRRKESRLIKPVSEEAEIAVYDIKNKLEKLKKLRSNEPVSHLEFERLLLTIFEDLIRISEFETPIDGVSNAAEERNGFFLRALQNLRGEFGGLKLGQNLWVEAWQEITTHILITYKRSHPFGVWAVNLRAAEAAPPGLLIILGAVQESQRRSVVSLLSDSQIDFLFQLGFDFPARPGLNGYLAWLQTGSWKKIIISSPKSDHAGKSLAANPVWLDLANKAKRSMDALDFSTKTNWIWIQKNILEEEVATKLDQAKLWTQGTSLKIGQMVLKEINNTTNVDMPTGTSGVLPYSLSATSIESYWQCPFKFFARNDLLLFDEADLDLEPSNQVKGQWLHLGVEKILKSEIPLNLWDQEKISNLVDELDLIQKQVAGTLWSSIRQRFVRQLVRFVDFEMNWRKLFPLTKTDRLEAAVKGYLRWSSHSKELRYLPELPAEAQLSSEGEYFVAPFKGKIDRIDKTSDGRGLIIDYKSSNAQSSQIASWNKKGSFQLALYTRALEAGFVRDSPKNIIAAQYYSLKKIEREKGYHLVDEDLSGVLPAESKSRAGIGLNERNKFLGEIEESVTDVLEGVRLGKRTPEPRHEKYCNSCSWRTLCRAHHLS